MKQDIHQIIIQLYSWTQLLVSNSYQVLQRILKKLLSGKTGNTYPLIRVEVTSDSHPFYTGRQKFTQADGRVDRFNKNTVSKTQTLQNKTNNCKCCFGNI